MALCHVVHLSSQGPVSGAADKLPRPWPIQYVASVVGPDSLNTSKELSFFVTGLKTQKIVLVFSVVSDVL